MQKKVLLAFDDPGGGLAVSSLLDRLKNTGLNLKIYTGQLSKNFVNKYDYQILNSNISKDDAHKILFDNSPDILVTGTSAGNSEQELRNAAYKNNIRSVVILDFWKDYSRRWLYADYPVNELKDTVCVMDQMTKSEMLEEKFPDDKLTVTGHPYLDKLFNSEKVPDNTKSETNNTFLFLSQPLHIIGIVNYKVHPFKTLLEALKKFTIVKDEKIILKIKLHPVEEESEDLNDLVREYDSEILKIEFADRDLKIKEILEKSELVFGYNTIAMFESRAMGKRTISMRVVPVRNSLEHAMLTAGIETADANENDLFDCLMKENNPEANKDIFNNGIKNCVEVILKELTVN